MTKIKIREITNVMNFIKGSRKFVIIPILIKETRKMANKKAAHY